MILIRSSIIVFRNDPVLVDLVVLLLVGVGVLVRALSRVLDGVLVGVPVLARVLGLTEVLVLPRVLTWVFAGALVLTLVLAWALTGAFFFTVFFLTVPVAGRMGDLTVRLLEGADDFALEVFDIRLATAGAFFFVDFPAMSPLLFQRHRHPGFSALPVPQDNARLTT